MHAYPSTALASIIDGLEDLLDKLVSKDGLYYLTHMVVSIPGMVVTVRFCKTL